MAEGIHVVPHRGGDAALLLIILLGVQALPGEALPGGKVAVRLDVPAVDRDEAALFDPGLYLLEHLRRKLLDPLVNGYRGADEFEVRELLHPVQGRADGGLGLGAALLPVPEPHRVQMGVADHINVFHLGHGKTSLVQLPKTAR